MAKYSGLKRRAQVTARKEHGCQRCGAPIQRGGAYWNERIDLVRASPVLALGKVCQRCYQETVSGETTAARDPE